MTPKEVLKLVQEQSIRFVDLRFMDFPGLWQHTTVPVSELTLDSFTHGFGFDGSSIRGWQAINESDMLLVPVPDTAKLDPFLQHPTLSVICDVRDPITKKEYSRDPRSIARKTVEYLRKSRIADTANFGPELEFFIFDEVRFDSNQHSAFYSVDSDEGIWNSGAESTLRGDLNQGYRPRYKEGYFPVSPHDTQTDIRNEMVEIMEACGIQIELHHHEVATAGQGEIDMRFDTLTKMGDKSLLYKYIVKNVAKRPARCS